MAIFLSEKQVQEGWQVVKFGEIARNISERVNPSETNLDVYVGLEHLDPQSLRISRRGVPSDVKGQKLRVRPGQIIFGKRRAYQKKLAVADFDGICSAHAMVLEAVPGKIIPELLPFFMQSDMFMDRAVAISEGSLSPTIKWKTLAIQEFPLPPIERQKEILEVLEKVEESELKIDNILNSAFKLMNSSMRYLFNPQKDWRTTKLHEVGDIVTGKTPPKKDSSNWNGTYLWATAEDFNGKYINDTKLKLTTKRPMRNDAKEGEEKDPIEQALGYLERIRQGKVKTSAGRPIPHSDSIPGFCYVICDITPSIQNRCKIHDAILTSDGLGYFFYNKSYGTYVEVVSFDRLVNSAKEIEHSLIN